VFGCHANVDDSSEQLARSHVPFLGECGSVVLFLHETRCACMKSAAVPQDHVAGLGNYESGWLQPAVFARKTIGRRLNIIDKLVIGKLVHDLLMQ